MEFLTDHVDTPLTQFEKEELFKRFDPENTEKINVENFITVIQNKHLELSLLTKRL